MVCKSDDSSAQEFYLSLYIQIVTSDELLPSVVGEGVGVVVEVVVVLMVVVIVVLLVMVVW